MDSNDTQEIRTAADAGWHVSRYNVAARIPDSKMTAIFNTYRHTCARYTPIELCVMDILDEVPEDHPLIGRLAKRGVIANFDEREAFAMQRRVDCATAPRGEVAITICPTLACNFECPYCFATRGRGKMAPEVQDEIVALAGRMLDAGHARRLVITWFGGEPLMGAGAIDIISDELAAKGIGYTSRMVSNCLLFDEGLVQRAKERWNLNYVQVTLDGTEEVYNRTKAFVDYEGSAFQRVLDNMDLLLDAEITVAVRLNLHADNLDDLLALIDQLAERFGGRKGIGAYAAMLREDDGTLVGFDSETAAFEAYAAMTDRLLSTGLASQRAGNRNLKLNHCMADSDTAVTIMPEGTISKCEHYSETELVSSIDSDEWDTELLQSWKERWPATELCHGCPRYPICYNLRKCPYTRTPCNELERDIRIQQLIQSVAVEYRRAVEEDG